MGQPVIGRLNDGNYYAIFGNGYNSAHGCPVLYLVNIATGAIRRLSAAAGNLGSHNSAAVCTTYNGQGGLGRPSLFDDPSAATAQPASQTRTTDAIYAADLQGQIWKFDVSSSNANNWDVAGAAQHARLPLFIARNACGGVEPITSLIEIGAPPSGQTGAMLFFGTGSFMTNADRTDMTRQSFYGLLDAPSTQLDNPAVALLNTVGAATAAPTPCAAAPVPNSSNDLSGRARLVGRTLGAFKAAVDPNGNPVQTRSFDAATPIDYSASGNSRRIGWYVDLPLTGERVITAPMLQTGRVRFATLIPNENVCAGGGAGAIVAADPYNGGKTAHNIFNVNGLNTAGMYDSIMTPAGVIKNLIAVDSGTQAYLFAGGSLDSIQPIKIVPQQKTGGTLRGRIAWREVFQ
jgi:type IV pilus assembly protein PilY1